MSQNGVVARRICSLTVGGVLLVLITACAGPRTIGRPAGVANGRLQATGGPESAGQFAPGACQTLAPLGPDRHVVVFLDPGHGNPDPGTSGLTTTGTTVEEKDLTLQTVNRAAALLRTAGYTVVQSRTGDTSVAALTPVDLPGGVFSVAGKHKDLLARVACANATHAHLLVSLHFNGFDVPSVGGAETFYDAARPFSAQNRAVATLLQQDILAELAGAGWPVPDRGIAVDATDEAPTLSAAAAAYHHLLELGPAQPGYLDQPSAMPGALCEPLFLTAPGEASIAASDQGQAAIARGIVMAVERFLPGN